MKIALAVQDPLITPQGYGARAQPDLYKALLKMCDLTAYSPFYQDLALDNVKHWELSEFGIPSEEYDCVLNNSRAVFHCSNIVNYDFGYKQTKNVAVMSKNEARRAKEEGIYSNYAHPNPRVVYLGTDTEYFKFNPNKEDYFVYFGRIHPSKGADVAVSIAERTGIKLKLMGEDQNPLVFGGGDDARQLHQFIDSLKERVSRIPNVEYLGSVTNDQVVDILGRAKGMICPVQGSFQSDISVVQALSCGTPVIVSDIPADSELVDPGVTGFICPPQDWNAWASAIGSIGQIDPYKVREVAYEKWSSKRMASELMALLEEVSKGGSW